MHSKANKLVAVGCAALLCLSIASGAFAAGKYTPIAGTNTVLKKSFLMKEGVLPPKLDFEFSIEPGTQLIAVPGQTVEVLSPSAETGVTGTPRIGKASYNKDDTASATAPDGVTVESGKVAVVKDVVIDFSGVRFSEPGIYRYLIKETSSGQQAITYDTQTGTGAVSRERTLDVYVTDDNGALKIEQYVIHELSGTINANETYGSHHDPVRLADKSAGYVNEYTTHNLTVSEIITGNQGSKEKYFKIDIELENLGDAEELIIDWSNAEDALNPDLTNSTKYNHDDVINSNNRDDNPSKPGYQIEVDEDGKAHIVIYLSHEEEITITGLPEGSKYTATITPEDYDSKSDQDKGNGQYITGGDIVTEPDGMEASHEVIYELGRNGVVPTGVVLSAAGSIALTVAGVAGIGGIGFAAAKAKRKSDSEDDEA